MGERFGANALGRLTLEHVVIVAVAVVGASALAGPISDNSALVHIRTGIEMVRSGSIPRHDPYSFSAYGHSWIVESWFASYTYGLMHALGGVKAIIAENMVLSAALAFVMALLARTGTMVRTLAVCVIVISLGFPNWSPRPLMFGLLGMALLVYVVEGRRSPWLLLPIMWVWVNTHGSWLLGLIWLGCALVGSYLDEHKLDRTLTRYAAFAVVGVVVGAVNPLGPRLLTFPAAMLGDHRNVFAHIEEWQPLDLAKASGLFTLFLMSCALVMMLRTRLGWRRLVPAVVFFFASLYSGRHLPVFAIVVTPVLASALRMDAGASPRVSKTSPVMLAGVLAVMCVACLVMIGRVVEGEPTRFAKRYPVAGINYLESRGLLASTHRLAAREIVGCYLIYTKGTQTRVWIDDRFDMYPVGVSADLVHLSEGDIDPEIVLDRYDIDVVLWERNTALETVLTRDERWKPVWNDEKWVVYEKQEGAP